MKKKKINIRAEKIDEHLVAIPGCDLFKLLKMMALALGDKETAKLIEEKLKDKCPDI